MGQTEGLLRAPRGHGPLSLLGLASPGLCHLGSPSCTFTSPGETLAVETCLPQTVSSWFPTPGTSASPQSWTSTCCFKQHSPAPAPAPAQASTQSCTPTVPSSGPRGQTGTPRVMLTAQEPSGSLGVLGGGLCPGRSGQSRRPVPKEAQEGRVGERVRTQPGALSSSPRRCASSDTACRRGGH